ncbi:MAG: hypothetical protein KA175_01980 [Flavobacteriales bacterium]|nr:hypothetical protein [Flavobacteriales bacterium]MBP6696357.1 hypothetical protein [Flavobacteriales bacterium]
MKHTILRTVGFAFLLLLSFGASAQGRWMEVIFTPEMDEARLTSIQDEAKANGLELSYTHLNRDNGRITSLAFVLKTKKGMGTAETDNLSEDKPFGFRYDPKAGGGEATFSVGSLEPIETKGPADVR